jgi:hypothetical protein
MPTGRFLFHDRSEDSQSFLYRKNDRKLLSARLPKIIMRIAVRYRSKEVDDVMAPHDSCDIYLHQTISGQMAYYILRTPVFRPRRGSRVLGRSRLESPELDRNLVTPTAQYTPQDSTQLASSIIILPGVYLYPNGSLQSKGDNSLNQMSFQARTCYTVIEGLSEQELGEGQSMCTALELLNLQGCNTHGQPRAESDGSPESNRQVMLPRSNVLLDCTHWNVSLSLGRGEIEDFFGKVSSNLRSSAKAC